MKLASNISPVEIALREQIAKFYADPLGFVLFAYPWGEPGTDLANQSGPDDWQRRILKRIGEEINNGTGPIRIAISSGHGIGKTALVAWINHWFISTRAFPSIVDTANTKDQLEAKTWRELAIWINRAINKHWFTHTATKLFLNEHPETWFAKAQPWSKERSEAFAGTHAEHVLLVFDEASAIDDIIWQVAEGALTTPGAIFLAFGNPTRNSGRFFECFNKLRHRWITEKIDSRTAKMTDKGLINQWIEDYGEDSDYVRVRVRGEFPRASSMQFISTELVEQAEKRKYDSSSYVFAPIIIGVDVARFGDDSSVLAIRQGLKLHELVRYRELDTMQLAAQVIEFEDLYQADQVFVDVVGVGAGVLDRGRQLGRQWIGVGGAETPTDKKYANKSAECWGLMRDALKDGLSIPVDDQLKTDMISREYGYNAKNQIQLEKKEDMKRRGLSSPDNADATSITYAYPVTKKTDPYYEAQKQEEYWNQQTGTHSLIGGY